MSGEDLFEGVERENYRAAVQSHTIRRKSIHGGAVVVVEASSMGFRYSVVLTVLPDFIQGGRWLVTILSPTTVSFNLGDPFGMRVEDLFEKLPDDYRTPYHVAALIMTINHALLELDKK